MSEFKPFASRIYGEAERRLDMAARAIRYHLGFLDDCLRGILPHDLILIGAPTGIGKTDMALNIAASNAMHGKRVHYFALEAEPDELERRTKFALLSRRMYAARHPMADAMNYADWLLGRCEEFCAVHNEDVERECADKLRTLHTFYRGAHFGPEDLAREVFTVHDASDLIVIDHLHYIDASDNEDEHRALGDTVKTIRDISLRIGKPVILIAHLRKRDQRAKQLVATIDDFHGSSNITKICTQAIALEHAYDIEPTKWYLAPTFITVLKDRRAGAPRVVALADFDRRTKGYATPYTLGRIESGRWEELPMGSVPSWAKHHRPRAS